MSAPLPHLAFAPNAACSANAMYPVLHAGVLWRELVAVLAVRSGVRQRRTGRARLVDANAAFALLWINNRSHRKSGLCALNNCLGFLSGNITKVCGDILQAVNRYLSRLALVSRLLRARRPSTIRRLVVAVVVDAIKGCSWRFWPHVVGKRLERIPPLAYADAASTVVLPVWNIGISAPLFHVHPNLIKRVRVCERHGADHIRGERNMQLAGA